MMNLHLLLVEDDPDLCFIVGILTRRLGCQLTRCSDVSTAWKELAGAGTFDLVLLDVNLPGASGLELLQQIREEKDLPLPPVALFCQPHLEDDVAAGWERGADYLFCKDLVTQLETFRSRLQEIVEHCSSRNHPERLCFNMFLPITTELLTLDHILRCPLFARMPERLLRQVVRRAGLSEPGDFGSIQSNLWQNQVTSLLDQAERLYGKGTADQILSWCKMGAGRHVAE